MASIQKRTLQDGSIRWLAQICKKGFKTVNITKNTKAAVEKAARHIEVAMENDAWDEFASPLSKKANAIFLIKPISKGVDKRGDESLSFHRYKPASSSTFI